MVYCAGKLKENFKLYYKSNRPHFLWGGVITHLGCWKITSHEPRVSDLQVNPWNRKCGLLLKYLGIERVSLSILGQLFQAFQSIIIIKCSTKITKPLS